MRRHRSLDYSAPAPLGVRVLDIFVEIIDAADFIVRRLPHYIRAHRVLRTAWDELPIVARSGPPLPKRRRL